MILPPPPHLLLVDRIPVIGTLHPATHPIHAGDVVRAAVERDFFSPGYITSPNLILWRQRMRERRWEWIPRYGANNIDRNATGDLAERSTDGRSLVYAPTGNTLPPDGWLITPHETSDQRCDGQTAFAVQGVVWAEAETSSSNTLRTAILRFTGATAFIPLASYYHDAA